MPLIIFSLIMRAISLILLGPQNRVVIIRAAQSVGDSVWADRSLEVHAYVRFVSFVRLGWEWRRSDTIDTDQ
jgi:hypothetical protein